jgi:hypothetical protein
MRTIPSALGRSYGWLSRTTSSNTSQERLDRWNPSQRNYKRCLSGYSTGNCWICMPNSYNLPAVNMIKRMSRHEA